MQDIFLKLDVGQAQATNEDDRQKILDDIKASTGVEVHLPAMHANN